MYSHIDASASFSDWNATYQFGGWAAPNVKNYNAESLVCGARFGLTYFWSLKETYSNDIIVGSSYRYGIS